MPVKRSLLLSLFLITSACVHADEPLDIPYTREIQVYWTDTPPILDGKPDDPCWQDARIATDFRQLDRKHLPARQQTRVQLCYDAENIYLLYIMDEAEIHRLQAGPADDTRDNVDVNKDVIELFLDPGRTESRYFHFMTAPGGARYDARHSPEFGREIGLYTPDWTVATHVGDTFWAVEMKIPFAELAFPGGFIGTPRPGDQWGINFCRDQSYLNEWSFWSPTRDRSFHRPAQIGVAVFSGRPHDADPPAIAWDEAHALGYGPGQLRLIAPNTDAHAWNADWTILHNRKPRFQQDETGLALPMQIVDAGRWDVRVSIEDQGQTVFTGRTFVELPPIREFILDVHQQLATALPRAGQIQHPAARDLAERLKTLQALVTPLAAMMACPDSISTNDWAVVDTRIPEMRDLWQPAQYGIGMLNLASDAPGAFAVGITGSTKKIDRFRPVPFYDEPVDLWMAGRERESFQLAVMPFWEDVTDIEISFTPLRGSGVELPADCFESAIVDYIRAHEAWGGDWVPDILNPGTRFDLHNNQTQPVWIDVHLPAGTQAGTYEGAVIVHAGSSRVEIPVRVHAFGFDIPEKRSLHVDTWYWPSQMWKSYYEVHSIPFTPELYEAHLKVLSKYRYASYTADVGAMWSLIRVYQEPDGQLTFDFSGMDWMIELGRQYGADAFSASFACNFAALRPFVSGGIPILDRQTGERVSSMQAWSQEQGFEYVRGVTRKSAFAHHPAYTNYLHQFVAYLREKDMLDVTDYEIYDEPRQGDEWADITAMHGFLKRHVPELKLKSYGVAPDNAPEGYNPVGLYDIWAPVLGVITPERWERLRERQRKGERFWFYTCASAYRDIDGASRPYICYHQPLMASRIHGWAAWKLGVDGMLIFALNATPGTNVQPDKARYFTHPIWESKLASGQGTLVYPGPDYTMIPSIRLANVRDGLEDYEFFAVLAERRRHLDPERDAALIREIDDALTISDDIVPWDWHAWTRDVEKLNARRQRLAALILKAGR